MLFSALYFTSVFRTLAKNAIVEQSIARKQSWIFFASLCWTISHVSIITYFVTHATWTFFTSCIQSRKWELNAKLFFTYIVEETWECTMSYRFFSVVFHKRIFSALRRNDHFLGASRFAFFGRFAKRSRCSAKQSIQRMYSTQENIVFIFSAWRSF